MSTWISVKDKLPEVSEPNGGQSVDVLVTDGHQIDIGYYESEYNIEDDPLAFEEQTDIYSSDMWHCNQMSCEPAHWMPLPELPTPESTND